MSYMKLHFGFGFLVPEIPFKYSDHLIESKSPCRNGRGMGNGARWLKVFAFPDVNPE